MHLDSPPGQRSDCQGAGTLPAYRKVTDLLHCCWKEGGGERLSGARRVRGQGSPSSADEAGVEGAGEAGVGGALDQGAAIGEEGDCVWAAAEAEKEGVGTQVLDVGVGGEAAVEAREINEAVMLVNLDGVAAA